MPAVRGALGRGCPPGGHVRVPGVRAAGGPRGRAMSVMRPSLRRGTGATRPRAKAGSEGLRHGDGPGEGSTDDLPVLRGARARRRGELPELRDEFGLGGVPILWLSNVGKEDSVRPKDLEKLSLSLEQFLSRDRGIIVIDGIEYLITNNNFITVLRLVQALRDRVAMNGAILLFSVNPASLDEHQLHLLEREVDQVLDLRG